VCDCPASEPPLSARITVEKTLATVPANSNHYNGRDCSRDIEGAILLSGGCTSVSNHSDAILLQSGFETDEARGWICEWQNPTSQPVDVEIIVKCLNPAL
jgi:hypothetical protein